MSGRPGANGRAALVACLAAVAGPLAAACDGAIGDPPAGLDGGAAPAPPPGPATWVPGESDPGEGLVRRLTREEVLRSVRDVLGVTLPPADAALLPPETASDGFRNTAAGLVITPAHARGLFELAPRVVAALPDLPALVDEHTHCRDPDRPECRRAFVEALGSALFRRPLWVREVDLYASLFDTARQEGLGFVDGAALALEAMLQAPPFLYRLERQRFGRDGSREVSPDELAARLAFFLWGSAPDRALRDAARDGDLGHEPGIRAEVARMLADEARAREASRTFVADWLALHRLDGVVRDGLDRDLAAALRGGAEATWQSLVWERRRALPDALVDPVAWLPRPVARWYGLPDAAEPLAPYDLADVDERVGLFTHPAVLTVMSDRDVGGIVARGLFVMEHLLCSAPLEPPPDLDLSSFRSHLGPGATDREYAEDRLATGACAGCHRQFDPLAFGLERFDGLGRYVTASPTSRPLRWDGVLPTPDGPRAHDDVRGWAAILADDPRVARCVTAKVLQFALGRPLGPDDAPWLDAIHAEAEANGGTWAAVATAVAAHPLFRSTRVE